MLNSRVLGTHSTLAPLVQLEQPCMGGYNAHPVRRSHRLRKKRECHANRRPAGTWGLYENSPPPMPNARVCSTYKDTITMSIQRVRTADTVDNYQPLPRHIRLKPAYFKTNNRANRKSDLTQINPTHPYMLCIIGAFKGIPSCRFYTRHNIKCSQQMNINLHKDTVYGLGITDRWDSCDMIQSLMITDAVLVYIRLIKYILFYGNKKKERRLNAGLLKLRLLIGMDCK